MLCFKSESYSSVTSFIYDSTHLLITRVNKLLSTCNPFEIAPQKKYFTNRQLINVTYLRVMSRKRHWQKGALFYRIYPTFLIHSLLQSL